MPLIQAVRCTRGRISASLLRQKLGQWGALDEGLEVRQNVRDVEGEVADAHREGRKSVVRWGVIAVIGRGTTTVVGRGSVVSWGTTIVSGVATATVQTTASDGLVGAGDGIADLATARVEVSSSKRLGLLAVVVRRVGVVLGGLLTGNLAGRDLSQIVIYHVGGGGRSGQADGSSNGAEGKLIPHAPHCATAFTRLLTRQETIYQRKIRLHSQIQVFQVEVLIVAV